MVLRPAFKHYEIDTMIIIALFPDFSLPVVFGDTVIISKKVLPQISGNFITAIFDAPTSLCLFSSILLVILSLWSIERISKTSKSKHSITSIATYCIGATLCQGFPKTFKFCPKGKSLAALYCHVAMIFTAIYSGE